MKHPLFWRLVLFFLTLTGAGCYRCITPPEIVSGTREGVHDETPDP